MRSSEKEVRWRKGYPVLVLCFSSTGIGYLFPRGETSLVPQVRLSTAGRLPGRRGGGVKGVPYALHFARGGTSGQDRSPFYVSD